MPIPIVLAGVGKRILGTAVRGAIARAVQEVASDKNVPEMARTAARPVATAVIEALAQDQQFVNASNSEPLYQSGIAWGAGITALGVLVPMVANLFGVHIAAERVVEIGGSIVTIAGIAFTLYRRFMPGLRPLFSGGN